MATPFSRLGYALLCVLLTGLGRPGDFEFNEILIPETFERPAPTVENRRIFQGWEHLPQSVREFETPPGKIVEEMALPAGNLLVVANPANLARAYALIGDAVKKAELEVSPPLMIVIHADDNVSVGLRVDGEDIPPSPSARTSAPFPPCDGCWCASNSKKRQRPAGPNPLLSGPPPDCALKPANATCNCTPANCTSSPAKKTLFFSA
ncbi:MAG: hypothetical protein JJU29_09885 [Verrucomicrobia bacterium]|nr:hypothetical protein [Verrucomicrobiota bacterium]